MPRDCGWGLGQEGIGADGGAGRWLGGEGRCAARWAVLMVLEDLGEQRIGVAVCGGQCRELPLQRRLQLLCRCRRHGPSPTRPAARLVLVGGRRPTARASRQAQALDSALRHLSHLLQLMLQATCARLGL
jgi:hypothetical protein